MRKGNQSKEQKKSITPIITTAQAFDLIDSVAEVDGIFAARTKKGDVYIGRTMDSILNSLRTESAPALPYKDINGAEDELILIKGTFSGRYLPSIKDGCVVSLSVGDQSFSDVIKTASSKAIPVEAVPVGPE